MTKKTIAFSSASVTNYFDADFSYLGKIVSKDEGIIITDENILKAYSKKFQGWKVVAIKAGEQHKNQQTVDSIIDQLIELGADRQTFLVGVGGGVLTDMTGYVAAIYMRGIRCGYVPTSILAMVDAAIGGKNGIDVGLYKNMVGIIRQPAFILYDYSFLKLLPQAEWVNGFAEIIKHACIRDVAMFKLLEENKLTDFQKDKELLSKLIQRNALLKSKVVAKDEYEHGERKFLNFGHTIAHAIENLYQIPHGHAVSIGMGVACKISEQLNSFSDTTRVTGLLKKYGLPPQFEYDKEQTLKLLRADKKKEKDAISYILLQKIGKPYIASLPFQQIESLI
ncbi:MAG: 3-dehydroquinate synthase [Segetibacter sp.]